LHFKAKLTIQQATIQGVPFSHQQRNPTEQVKKAEFFRPEAATKLPILKQQGFLLTLMAFVLHPIVPEVFAW
jgi:hypothetical protein